jgi:hypothetical protein
MRFCLPRAINHGAMRLPVLISVCLLLAATLLSAKAPDFSRNRDLPPLRLAAADLDTILLKTQSLIAAANGPSGEQDSGRESVKLGVRGKEIEIPHFSLASSVAFPREIFRFSYTYYRPDKAVSSVRVDLGDSLRRGVGHRRSRGSSLGNNQPA